MCNLIRYEIIPDNIYSVENNAAGKGLMSYILEGVMNNYIQNQLLNKSIEKTGNAQETGKASTGGTASRTNIRYNVC